MTGPSIDLVAMDAKLDNILTQLSTMNKRLNSHDERIARMEKFQQDKKMGATATPTATVAFSRSLVPVKALEGDMAVDAQANANVNQVATLAGGAVQRYVPPHRRARAKTPLPKAPKRFRTCWSSTTR